MSGVLRVNGSRRRLLFGAAGVALLGSGRAASQASLDVPLVRQKKDGCGAAALAMVLDYWRAVRPELSLPPTDAEALYRQLYSAERRGVVAGELVRYLSANHYHALPLQASRADLEMHLQKGRPLIAAVRHGSRLHYVVVRGAADEVIWLNDPGDGKAHRLPWETFAEQWRSGGNWILLAVPRGDGS